jgi:hypothetical protein
MHATFVREGGIPDVRGLWVGSAAETGVQHVRKLSSADKGLVSVEPEV